MRSIFIPSMFLALFLAIGFAPTRVSSGELKTLEQVNTCIKANIPKKSSAQIAEFITRDKLDFEKNFRAEICAKRGDDDLRKVLMLFTSPQDLRGAQYLMLETKDRSPDMFIYTPEMRKVKRITGQGASGSLFGTDFTYEDFQRMQHLNQPGDSELLEDEVVMDRPAYVIETKPSAGEKSSYEAIVTYWDQQTCVALKTDSFERGRRLRKVLSCDPEQIQKSADSWVCQSMLMEDVRDKTQTTLVIESMEVDVPIKDRKFSATGLGKNKRCAR